MFDTNVMSLLTMLMIMTAVVTTVSPNVFGSSNGSEPPRPTVMRPAPTPPVQGLLDAVNPEDRAVMLLQDGRVKKFNLSRTVSITRDGSEVDLGTLSQGDFVVLTLSSENRDLVTKVQAITRR